MEHGYNSLRVPFSLDTDSKKTSLKLRRRLSYPAALQTPSLTGRGRD